MFNSPEELLRADLNRVAQDLQAIKSDPGRKAVATFLTEDPTFVDYLELVNNSLEALTTYNRLALENATGPDPDAFLAERATYAAGALKEMRVALDRVTEHYRFMFD